MKSKILIEVAIDFLFPKLSKSSKEFKEIVNFVEREFDRLGTSVLYYRNESFMNLLARLGLSIGEKEVIITSNSVRTTMNYKNYPAVIFEL